MILKYASIQPYRKYSVKISWNNHKTKLEHITNVILC